MIILSFFVLLLLFLSRTSYLFCFFFFLIALESRTTIQKSAKGPISIGECDAQGKFITIENTSRSKSMVLSGWTVRQQAENGETLKFSFPENCLLRPNNSIKVNISCLVY